MSLLQLRRLLFVIAAAFGLAVGGVALWAGVNPVASPALEAAPTRVAPRAGVSLNEVLDLSLRPAPKVKVQAAPLRIKLSGTIMDGANSQAMIVDGAGQTQFVKVGETVDEIKLLSVNPTSVEVEYQDNKQTLEVAP